MNPPIERRQGGPNRLHRHRGSVQFKQDHMFGGSYLHCTGGSEAPTLNVFARVHVHEVKRHLQFLLSEKES